MTKRLVMLVVLLFCSFVLASCGSKITAETLENLKFESATVEYDGEAHSILVENIYEDKGVTVQYTNNKKIAPGNYVVKAKISYKNIVVDKEATLTIEKKTSVLSAENVQTFYMTDDINVAFNLDNDKQTVSFKNELGVFVDANSIKRPGTYNLELFAQETKYYKESNHVNVKLVILQSAFDVTFDNKKVVADGSEQTIELEGTLPDGYTVNYENNKGTEDGKYYAVANIVAPDGSVAETHKAVLEIDYPENAEFAKFLDEFFVEYLENDQLSVNIFCENPADFGLEHYDAEWYTFKSFTDDELASDLEYFEDLKAELELYKDYPLNNYQEIAYDNIQDFLNYYSKFYSIKDSIYMEVSYIDQFGGYVADFGTYMEAYSLRSEQEVKDIVSFIQSTKTAFPSYLDFIQEKLDRGYGLSDYTINEMRDYLKELLESKDGYYLEDVLVQKIDGLSFLTDDQKAEYKKQVSDGIKDCFMVGVQSLYDGLSEFLGKVSKEQEGYWSIYENGKTLFELSLEDLLGYKDIDMNEYIKTLDDELARTNSDTVTKQYALIDKFNITTYDQLEALIKRYSISDATPDEMMVFLKDFAKSLVPLLKSEPDIVIKEMDEASAKISNALAYYMKSALDNTSSEYITLNPVTLLSSSNNDIIGTLAHEGYPGHLYAYVYSKELDLPNISKIMTSVAHGEGWATYVQYKLYEYAKELNSDEKFDMIMDYLMANQLSSYLLECRLDAGIHYEGWKVKDVANFLKKLGYNEEAAQEIFNLLIETPAQYAAYGYGKYIFTKIHNEAKETLGNYYDEVEFNAMILSNGWVGLETLEQMCDEYLDDKCFQYGIER